MSAGAELVVGVLMLPVFVAVVPVVASWSRFHRYGVTEEVEEVPPGLSARSAACFERRRGELGEAGFGAVWLGTHTGSSFMAGRPSAEFAVIEVYEHARDGRGAALMVTSEAGVGSCEPAMVRFHDRLGDGRVLATATSEWPSLFPTPPWLTSVAVPQSTTAGRAAAAHAALVRRESPGRRLRGPRDAGGGEAYFAEYERPIIDTWVEKGWVKPDRRAGRDEVYRLTAWRAALGGWGLMPPVARWRSWRKRVEGGRRLVELGV